MRSVFTTLFLCFLLVHIQAQNKYLIKPENADCSRPIEIKDTLFGPTNAPAGYGSVMEISGSKNSLYEFEQEHNTVWYYFRIWSDCDICIDIVPVDPKDDYDFILYKYTDRNFCSDIKNKKIKPVRSCISRNDKSKGSKTGLSKTATDEFIHSGPGPSYSKYISVKKGEIYYLVVDNVYEGGSGHSIYLHYSNCTKPVVSQEVKPKTNTKENKEKQTPVPENATVNINIIDKESGALLRANVQIFLRKKEGNEAVLSFDSIETCIARLALSSSYVIKVESNGYFDQAKDFKTSVSGENTTVTIEMSKIKVGQNVVFDNILFHGNTAEFLPVSTPSLESIANTLLKNPLMTIEIQGHVNCPTYWEDCKKMKDQNMRLSEARAKAVFDYLTDAGIDPDRMTYIGFGDTKMLYPDARSEDKMEKNRRVEIVIKSNE